MSKSELRIALGMRGGVSLAVWIGGACTEVDALAGGPGGDPFWDGVLGLSRHDRVMVDVIAGASAGGLNGALMAASMRYGFAFDRILDVWIRVANLGALLRPARSPTPSLLQGDEMMLTQFQKEVLALIESGGGPPNEELHLELHLTATLVEPVVIGASLPPDQRPSPRFGAGFHVRQIPLAPWLAPGLPDDTEAAVARLAVAARATSSYPVAFEAAAVRSSRPHAFGTVPASPAPSALTDMAGVFSERRGPVRSGSFGADDFVVSDGGILDNIPIGRAIESVAASPADHRTERVLIYVQPGGTARSAVVATAATDPVDKADQGADFDGVGEDEATREALGAAEAQRKIQGRRSSTSVVTGIIRTRLQPETIAEDLAQLDRYNQGVVTGRAVRRSVLGAALLSVPGIDDAADARWPEYVGQRSATDTQSIRRLLEDPVTTLAEDPFPITPPPGGCGAPGEWHRAPLRDWTTDDREQLDSSLLTAFRGRLDALRPRQTSGPFGTLGPVRALVPDGLLTVGTGGLWRLTSLLIEIAIELERALTDRDAREIVGQLKQQLYRLQLFVATVLDRNRRIRWVVEAAGPGPHGGATWVESALRRADSLIDAVPFDPAAMKVALLTDGSGLVEYARSVYAENGSVDPASLGTSLQKTVLLPVLDEIAQQLRDLAGGAFFDPVQPSGLLSLALIAGGSSVAIGRRLASLEVLCLPEHVAGTASRRQIGFTRLSCVGRTMVAPHFPMLRPEPPTGPHDPTFVATDDKLAGNELYNFASFIDERWRANDWMWGRLDAVPTLVDLLVTPESLTEIDGAGNYDKATIESVVTGWPHPTTSDAWHAFLTTEAWNPSADDIPATWPQDAHATPARPDETEGQRAEREHADALAARAIGEQREAATRAVTDVLVARRQWEVVAHAAARDLSVDPQDIGPDTVTLWMAHYEVGRESITKNRSNDYVELFCALSETAGWLVDDAASPYLGAGPRKRVRQVLTLLGRAAARFALAPKDSPSTASKLLRLPLVALALFLVTLAVVLLWAWTRDHAAAVVAGGAGAVGLAGIVGILVWMLGRCGRKKVTKT